MGRHGTTLTFGLWLLGAGLVGGTGDEAAAQEECFGSPKVVDDADQAQGLATAIDDRGAPIVCTPADPPPRESAFASEDGGLPPDMRGWECVPGVIRRDGIDAFWLEVDTNGPVAAVTIPMVLPGVIPPTTPPLTLVDDGTNGDQVAGDFVYTIGPFRADPDSSHCQGFPDPGDGPDGLCFGEVGTVRIEETDGTTSTSDVQIAFLAPEVPATTARMLSADVAVSPHLINVRTSDHATQLALRPGGDYPIPALTSRIYDVVPDQIDFFVFFSTNRVQRLPPATSGNSVAGMYYRARADYTGTGVELQDSSSLYGSDGVLMGLVALDAYGRGIHSGNLIHELTHQWAVQLSADLMISSSGHYLPGASTASLIGGFQWVDQGDGTFLVNCNEGKNGAHHAPPLDRYLAGFIPGHDVPDLHVNPSFNFGPDCGTLIESEWDVTIEDIQAIHGVRTPGPDGAKKHFRLAFVAESHDRMLNVTEMTFYEVLASHAAKTLAAEEPDPYVGYRKWVPITRYWGDGVTWTSCIPVRVGDLDGDGKVGFTDLTELLASWGPCGGPPCPADLDGDDQVGFTDLTRLLQNWGSGCPH